MDPIELQRLLDGELDHAQRRRLLCQLDEQPMQWRTVALAMLEEQAFQRELGPLSNHLSSPLPTQTPLIDNRHSTPAKVTWTNGSLSRWLNMALAASLLVGLGFLGGNHMARRFENAVTTLSDIASSAVATTEAKKNDPSESEFGSLKPVGRLSFTSDTASNASDDAIQLPMYETGPEQFGQMLLTQQQQMQHWNDQLRRRGYELDWRPEMIESRLPDGRAVIVPIQQMHVRSLGQ